MITEERELALCIFMDFMGPDVFHDKSELGTIREKHDSDKLDKEKLSEGIDMTNNMQEALRANRKTYLESIFNSEDEYDSPEMSQLSYGGEYLFSDNCKQVELNGDFSKSDLIKIAQSMQD